jgi:ribose 1,5-bisphosphokinase PhnN
LVSKRGQGGGKSRPPRSHKVEDGGGVLKVRCKGLHLALLPRMRIEEVGGVPVTDWASLRAALRTLATLIGEAPSRLVMAVPDALAVPLDAASALDEARQTNRELVAGRTEAENIRLRGVIFAARAELAKGHLVVLDIDVQGADNVRKRIPEALAIFVLPPNEQELLKRLRARGREDEAAIERRFAESKLEIARATQGHTFDAFVVNDTLPRATDEVSAIVAARLAKRD